MSKNETRKKALSIMLSTLTALTFAGCDKDSNKETPKSYYNPKSIVDYIDDKNLELQNSDDFIKNKTLSYFKIFNDSNYDHEQIDKLFTNIKADYKFGECYNFLNHYLDYLNKNNIKNVYSNVHFNNQEKNFNITYTDDNATYGFCIVDNSTSSKDSEIVIEDVMTNNLIFTKRYEFECDLPVGEKKQKDPTGQWTISYTISFRNAADLITISITNSNFMKKINKLVINQGSNYSISVYQDSEEVYKDGLQKKDYIKYVYSFYEIYKNNSNINDLNDYKENEITNLLDYLNFIDIKIK